MNEDNKMDSDPNSTEPEHFPDPRTRALSEAIEGFPGLQTIMSCGEFTELGPAPSRRKHGRYRCEPVPMPMAGLHSNSSPTS